MSQREYKIGEVSRLLGLTPEAIRYYEDQGIITPRKAEKTGYRYYNVWDIHILIHARSYRQYGFSLAETAMLLNQSDNRDLIQHLDEKEEEIQEAITEQLRLLRLIRAKKEHIARTEESIGGFRLEYSPEIYRLDTEQNYKLYESREAMDLMREWINRAPFVFPSALLRKEAVESGSEAYSFGLGVDSEYAGRLALRESPYIRFHPARLSVFTAFGSCSRMRFSAENLRPALEFMQRQGLRLCGDAVTRVVLMRRENGEYINRHQVWLPCE